MKTHKDNLEICDMRSYFSGSDIRIRDGLTNWKVYTEDKDNYQNLVEIPNKDHPLYEMHKEKIEESCFAEDEKTNREIYKLQNCIRLFPHDNDTSKLKEKFVEKKINKIFIYIKFLGGFFITVFKKKNSSANPDNKLLRNKDRMMQEEKGLYFMEDYPQILKSLKDYYGLSSDFPMNLLVTHSKTQKKINLVSAGLHDLLKADNRNQIKILAVGVKLFTVNKRVPGVNEEVKVENNSESVDCNYRICQDGLMFIIPFLRKRIFYVNLDFFKKILKDTDYKYMDIKDDEIRNTIKKMSYGCVIIICLKNFEELKMTQKNINELEHSKYMELLRENYLDSITCYNSQYRMSTMINKEHQHVFNLKYHLE